MGKGGNQTTTSKVELDPDLKAAALQNLDIGNEVAAIGMSPFRGASIAGFSPQQMAAMQSQDQAAAAFDMPSAVDWRQKPDGSFAKPQGMGANAMYQALTGMAAPTAQAGGQTGYSLIPFLEQGLANTPAAQLAATRSFLMDPRTGAAPTNASVPAPKTDYVKRGNKVVATKKKKKKSAEKSKEKSVFDILSDKEYQSRYEGGSR